MRPHGLLLLSLLSLGACRAADPPADPEPVAIAEARLASPLRSLAADWSSSSPWEFEQLVATLEIGPWDPAALEELGRALKAMDLISVRAAVLLAYGGDEAREVLLRRLEARVEGPDRESDAADLVAAEALARWPGEDTAKRLAALGTAPSPHPDLEVRVACAAVALDQGRLEGVPFLLRVLHAGTPAELTDPIDWTPTTTLAWAKSRASEALCRRAGVLNTFQADGSYEQQLSVARELERRLRDSE